MALKNYERLSEVYDLEWGRFSPQYLSLISELLDKRSIPHARILDIACGTGILTIELAKQGHTVYGIDISPRMIGKARAKSSGLFNAGYDVQDMREFSVEGRFDLVTCTFDSVNYILDPKELAGMFRQVAEVLDQSGLLIFDSNTHQHYLNHHRGEYQHQLGGECFLQKCIYDPEELRAETIFEFSDKAVETHRQRPYDLLELGPMLIQAGLRVVHAYAGFDKTPYHPKSERLICVVEKMTPEYE